MKGRLLTSYWQNELDNKQVQAIFENVKADLHVTTSFSFKEFIRILNPSTCNFRKVGVVQRNDH